MLTDCLSPLLSPLAGSEQADVTSRSEAESAAAPSHREESVEVTGVAFHRGVGKNKCGR
jgi:hypothetical protein